VEIFRTSVDEANAELRAEGKGECHCKIIYATVRFVTPERLRWYLEDCLQLAHAHPDLIIGFDAVGHEDPLIRLREYVPELLRFKQRQIEEGLYIPLILHAGETLGDGTGTDENLYDALLLGSKRLGHAYSLPKHPELMKLCRERNVCVESCPISNEVLRYVGNMASHPLPILVNHGVPVALSNDDPCQFGNFGLSYDFWQACNASQATGLAALKTFALTSLEHSRFTPVERVRHMERFNKDWEHWLTWIVESFGEKHR
jgi:adenosine deaminase CECR1